MTGRQLLTHMHDPWFRQCLAVAFDTPERLVEFDRLYGFELARRPSPIESLVDEATGFQHAALDRFTSFVQDHVFTIVPRPLEFGPAIVCPSCCGTGDHTDGCACRICYGSGLAPK